jgi:hypothetical protein
MARHGGQEAGAQFAEAYPLSRSAKPRRRAEWAGSLCAFLDGHFDRETVKAIRMDCACGPSRAWAGKIRAIYEQAGEPRAFVEKINQMDPGFSLAFDGAAFELIYPQCYCACVRQAEKLPESWCWCTLGFSRRLFETILGQAVEAELVSSIKQGDACCRIRITVRGV